MSSPLAPDTPVEQAPQSGKEQRRLRRRVMDLAGPVIGENLLQTLLGITDSILVAGLGVVALGGVGAALQVIFVLTAALSGLSVGASVLVSQAFGAGKLADAGSRARQALIWSVVISLPLGLIGIPLSPAIISLFGLPPATDIIASEYLTITIGGSSALTIMLLAGGVLRGANDSRTPMVVTLWSNVLNVGLSYVLIYGVFGFPALGAAGSAWGTVIARVLGAAALIWVLVRGRNGVRVSGAGGMAGWRPYLPDLRSILRIGMPAALEEVLVITAFAFLTPLVATLGTIPLAAHRVALNVLSLAFLPGIGLGLAATALVGQAVGAQRPDEARAVTAIALRWGLIWLGGLMVIFIVSAPWLARIFGDDPELVAVSAATIQVIALAQPFWAITFVYGGALRGTGDTRTPLVITGTINWMAVGVAFLLVPFWPSLPVIWSAFLISGPIEAYLFYRAWRNVQWRKPA
ncbi:MAG: MATE family efflux transporter [Oscillochloris sp.]|nr:MATE family efflux transporter [Oscillochloris sp.]